MQATAVTQATTVTPATSNIKDDSKIMTTHNSRKQVTVGMKATTGPPTQYGRHQQQRCLKTQ
jgi:hypothetical protein